MFIVEQTSLKSQTKQIFLKSLIHYIGPKKRKEVLLKKETSRWWCCVVLFPVKLYPVELKPAADEFESRDNNFLKIHEQICASINW